MQPIAMYGKIVHLFLHNQKFASYYYLYKIHLQRQCIVFDHVKHIQFYDCSVDLLWFPHGALDVERADILPVLLQQRNKEVDGKMNVGHQVILTHFNMANGYS